MKRRLFFRFLVLLLLLTLPACKSEPKEPPDLRGQWTQALSEDSDMPEYYHLAAITDDHIDIYYYFTADGSTNLFWSGSFTPPEDGKEPYVWVSQNTLSPNLGARVFRYASRDKEKEFTYKKGTITYTIAPSQALRMNVTLKRSEETVEIKDEAP